MQHQASPCQLFFNALKTAVIKKQDFGFQKHKVLKIWINLFVSGVKDQQGIKPHSMPPFSYIPFKRREEVG